MLVISVSTEEISAYFGHFVESLALLFTGVAV